MLVRVRIPVENVGILFYSILFGIFVSCDGIGTSIKNGDSYDNRIDTSGGSNGSSFSGSSEGSLYTAQELWALSNAGNIPGILSFFPDPDGTVMITLSSLELRLPRGGRVTLSIQGNGFSYEAEASASDDGKVYFQVPHLGGGMEVSVRIEVRKANGRLLRSGSASQQIKTGVYNEIVVPLVNEILPVDMQSGSAINTILTGSLGAGAGGTATAFRSSETPPPDGATTFLLSTAGSEVDVIAWREGSCKIPLCANPSFMFLSCTSLTDIDLSRFDTRNSTNFTQMFNGCTNLCNLNVRGWDTSNVTDMHFMFRDCNNLTGLDTRGWDTGNVTDMRRMFEGCSSLTSLDVSGWDTSKVTNIFCMFANCSSLTSLDVSRWDTGCVTNMNS
ncbi:MAG: BspA family leucine-rich repeat surface protein, partial [Treponema sp.]|nr:BspA family leucine-rich repeat surface protein [Treponema sp.]